MLALSLAAAMSVILADQPEPTPSDLQALATLQSRLINVEFGLALVQAELAAFESRYVPPERIQAKQEEAKALEAQKEELAAEIKDFVQQSGSYRLRSELTKAEQVIEALRKERASFLSQIEAAEKSLAKVEDDLHSTRETLQSLKKALRAPDRSPPHEDTGR